MSINMSAALGSLPHEKFLLFVGTGTLVEGRWVQNENHNPSSFTGIVQPAKPNDVKMLPEGSVSGEMIVIHTRAKLEQASEDTGGKGNVVERRRNNRRYRIMATGDWTRQGFNRYLAMQESANR